MRQQASIPGQLRLQIHSSSIAITHVSTTYLWMYCLQMKVIDLELSLHVFDTVVFQYSNDFRWSHDIHCIEIIVPEHRK